MEGQHDTLSDASSPPSAPGVSDTDAAVIAEATTTVAAGWEHCEAVLLTVIS